MSGSRPKKSLIQWLMARLPIPAIMQNWLDRLPLERRIHTSLLLTILPLLVLFFTSLLFVYLFVIYYSMDTQLGQKSAAARQNYSSLRQQLKTWARTLSSQKEIQLELAATPPNRGKLKRLLASFQKNLELDRIVLYDNNGALIAARLSREGLPLPPSDRVNQGKGISFQIVKTGPKGEKPQLFLDHLTPVRFARDTIGFISLGYEMDARRLAKFRGLIGTEVFFFYKNQIIATSAGKIFREKSGGWPELHLQRGPPEDLSFYLINEGNRARKKLRLRFVPLPLVDTRELALGWAVAVEKSNQAIWVEILFLVSLVLSGVIILGAVGVSYRMGNRIGQKTRIITNAMEEMSAGQLEKTIEFPDPAPGASQDEFNLIARRFNTMAGYLRRSYDSLELLNRLNTELSHETRPDSLNEALVRQATRLFPNSASLLFLRRQNQLELEARATGENNPWGDKLYEQITETRQPENSISFFLPDVFPNLDPSVEETFPLQSDILRELHLPRRLGTHLPEEPLQWLTTNLWDRGGKWMGILAVARTGEFTSHSQQLINSLAYQYTSTLNLIRQKQLESDIATGAIVQKNMVPQTVPRVPGLDLFGLMLPAKGIGGDYFDFIIEDLGGEKQLLMLVADISGKGIPAGLLMVMARTFIHSQLGQGLRPHDYWLRLNQFLFRNSENDKFLTGIFFKWNPSRQTLDFSGAGHEVFLLSRAPRGEKPARVLECNAGGTLVGILDPEMLSEQPEVGYQTHRMKFEPGDTVVVFTDGMTEARNFHGEEYGLERIREFLLRNRELPVEELVRELFADARRFIGEAPQHDDLTLFAFRREKAGVRMAGQPGSEQPAEKKILLEPFPWEDLLTREPGFKGLGSLLAKEDWSALENWLKTDLPALNPPPREKSGMALAQYLEHRGRSGLVYHVTHWLTKKYPKVYAHWLRRGQAEFAAGDFRAGLESWQKAVELNQMLAHREPSWVEEARRKAKSSKTD